MSIKPLIEVKDLTVSYGENVVLDHVTFAIKKGDYVGIVGPNGGGKTTLLKVLVGLLKAEQGTVTIDGMPIASLKNKFEIGYVPQRIAQREAAFPATVSEIVESGRIVRKSLFERMNNEDREAIKKAMQIANIENIQDRLMSNLSGGQQQRVYVARALASEPKILILDEPFVGIDIQAQTEFYSFLKELNQKQGLTILFVSHDVDMISQEATSILCLNRGLMCFGGPHLLHEKHVIESLYGKNITHLHHAAD